jgi:hypothetical protein
VLKDERLGEKEQMKRLFELTQNLVDLSTIETVIDKGGVKLMAKFLAAASTQTKKRAAPLLASH